MKDLAESFEQTLRGDLHELTADIGEALFDFAVNLPVFNLLKVERNIQNILLGRKIKRFLFGLSNVPYSERVGFLERALTTKQSTGNLYLLLLNTLNGLNQEEKADIVGFIVKLMIYEDLSIEIGLKLITIVSRLDLDDLRKLSNTEEDSLLKDQPLLDSLSGTGTITAWFQNFPSEAEGYPAPYKLNQLGKALLNTMKEYEKSVGSI